MKKEIKRTVLFTFAEIKRILKSFDNECEYMPANEAALSVAKKFRCTRWDIYEIITLYH